MKLWTLWRPYIFQVLCRFNEANPCFITSPLMAFKERDTANKQKLINEAKSWFEMQLHHCGGRFLNINETFAAWIIHCITMPCKICCLWISWRAKWWTLKKRRSSASQTTIKSKALKLQRAMIKAIINSRTNTFAARRRTRRKLRFCPNVSGSFARSIIAAANAASVNSFVRAQLQIAADWLLTQTHHLAYFCLLCQFIFT